MNYSKIKYYDIANGPGCRTSIFVSGCSIHCNGCFNQEAWDFNAGEPFTTKVMTDILSSCNYDYIKGISILGGEPLDPKNQTAVYDLIYIFRQEYGSKKDIWLYTGYTWDWLNIHRNDSNMYVGDILDNIDVLVDGAFEQDKADILLRFRGSSNQRLIDAKKSTKYNIVFWDDGPIFNSHASYSDKVSPNEQ